MNELEQNYLEHHGILGQKWHKRNGPPYPLDAADHSSSEKDAGYKKSLNGGHNEDMYDRDSKKAEKKEAKEHSKAVKKKAKEYEKEMNRLQEKEADYTLRLHENRKNSENIRNKKIKDNSKKAEKWINESNILDAKYDDILEQNRKNRKEINDLINKMFNDPDVVYKTRLTEYKPGLFNDSLSKENKNLVKDLNKKYGGKNRLNYYKQGGITSMTGTKYKVKSAETHGKKRSYNDPRKKKEYQHIHTTTRYYVY